MSILHPRSTPLPGAIAGAIGFTAAVLATIGVVALGATHRPVLALAALAIVVAVVAALTTWSAGVLTAGICWALDSGFVLGREAHLTFSPASAAVAAVLVAVALLAGAGGHLRRALKGPDRP